MPLRHIRLLITACLPVLLLLGTVAAAATAPIRLLPLPEGRTYDQAHDHDYLPWNGPVQYVFMTHRDNTVLPPEEGGGSCTTYCQEWVTRIGSGGAVSGAFDRDVAGFFVSIAFSHDGGAGSATLQACSASLTWNTDLGPGAGLPGFANMPLSVPAGCRSWTLSANGGYVDIRAVDVYYSGPPNTATSTPSRTPTYTPTITRTPTVTLMPSLTPTLTFTPTMTFTRTATFTNTPSPTPTPLPPQIVGVVVCDLWGDAGWCRGAETLKLTASDPQGFDVTITGDLNGEPFTCGSSCDLPLPEGTGIANYIVTSTSGRTAGGSSTWQRDGTPPDHEVVLPPADGRHGWHVSEVDLSASATDAISGLSILNGSLDGGTTWISFPVHFTDGEHQVLIHARDMAGNEITVSRSVRVDTVAPVVQLTSHTHGDVVQGDVQLSGNMEDLTSGPEGGEISIDGGNTWQPVLLEPGNWSFVWRSGEVPNGEYTIQMRGMDRAGNNGAVSTISLTVDNAPPAVSIPERWWIWETGTLKVSPNHFPIATIQVTIRDPQKRWKEVELDVDPGRNIYVVKWDRRFGDGMVAPSGEYPVLALACDVNGLCGQDAGRIVIPEMVTSTATLTPSPTATSTLLPSMTPVATQIPQTPTLVLITPVPEEQPKPAQSSLPLWQIIGLLGLFMVIASASVVDPRPKALERLGELSKVLSARAEDDSIDNKLFHKRK
ncbi:MAG: hypothetical protein KJZ77_04610 [Anaerolineales bacterium]|nr:hypothetical protein [Anaerolineales bacterium]